MLPVGQSAHAQASYRSASGFVALNHTPIHSSRLSHPRTEQSGRLYARGPMRGELTFSTVTHSTHALHALARLPMRSARHGQAKLWMQIVMAYLNPAGPPCIRRNTVATNRPTKSLDAASGEFNPKRPAVFAQGYCRGGNANCRLIETGSGSPKPNFFASFINAFRAAPNAVGLW
jgi:hypothetical protein